MNCVKSSGGRLYPPTSASASSRVDDADDGVPRELVVVERARHARRARAMKDAPLDDAPLALDDDASHGLAPRCRDDDGDDITTTATRARTRCIYEWVKRREATCGVDEGRTGGKERMNTSGMNA